MVTIFRIRNFHHKLFLAYAIFIVLFTVAITIPMYIYLSNNLEENINRNVKQKVENVLNSLDLYWKQYESMTVQLYLSDPNMDGLSQLMKENKQELDLYYADRWLNELILLISAASKDFLRINIFTESGEFFSDAANDTNVRQTIREMQEYLNQVRSAEGAAVISYKQGDRWLSSEDLPVLSFNRQLRWQDREVGFLEAQICLCHITSAKDQSELGTMYIYKGEQLIYPTGTHLINEEAYAYFSTSMTSNISGYTVEYRVPKAELFRPINVFRNVSFVAVLSLILFSTAMFYILSRIFTNPLKEMKRMLDSNKLIHSGYEPGNRYKMDEMEVLSRSFNNMNERLKDSLEKVVEFRTQQIKTHFDSLQSQMNPHFLFNMLGVIAIQADKEGGPETAGICRKLAHFLKYSMNAKGAEATLRTEISFATDYLDLMKSRYLHRLEYNIDVPNEMDNIPIPKFTLQPLIENSIKHGLGNPDKEALHIKVIGQIEGGYWEIVVIDDGSGFSKDASELLTHKMLEFDHREPDGNLRDPLIGGLGLLGTYIRIKLFYNYQIEFKFGNIASGGAFVKIRGIKPAELERRLQHESYDRR